MAGLKQLRNRVKSIKSTQKITKAMQLVAASKLNRIKDKAEDLNDYSLLLANIMSDVSSGDNLADLPFQDRKFFSRELKNLPNLLVVMTSERGLCGSFNSSVIKSVKAEIKRFKEQGIKLKLIIIGKRGYDALKTQYNDMIVAYYNIYKENMDCIAWQVKNKIITMIENEECGITYLCYNKFKNAITQVLTRQQILPVENNPGSQKTVSVYEYEGEGLVHQTINLYISGLVSYALLQSKASEEAARMTAMDNATKNAGELIDSLTLKLNRSRQAIITTELTEIISGAEAL